MRALVRFTAQADESAGADSRVTATMRLAVAVVVAAVTVLGATTAQFVLSHGSSLAPYAFFYFGVALASFYSGLPAGFLATLLSAFAVHELFLPPDASPASLASIRWLPTVTYIAVASTIAWLCHLGRIAAIRAERAAQSLSRTQLLYDSLFRNMREGLALCELVCVDGIPTDWILLSVNKSFYRLTGFEVAEGKRISELMPGFIIGNPEVLAICSDSSLQGTSHRFECYVSLLDKWFSVSVYSPSPGQFVTVFDDISDRKASEAALRVSEERYRLLFETSRDAIMTLGLPDCKFASGNAAAIRLFGARDLVEFTARAPWEFSPELQPSGIASERLAMSNVEIALHDGSNYFEWAHRRLDGTEFEATVLLNRLELAGQVQIQATVRDISATKCMERALQASERNYRTLLDQAGEGVLVVAIEDLQVVYANLAMSDAFGYAPSELCRITLPQLHPPDVESQLFAKLQSGGALTTRRLTEIPCQRKDGSRFWADIAVAPLEYAGRRCILGFFHDVTERRQVSQRLESEQQQRQLVEVELRHAQKLEAIGQMASGIAHEINTPAQFVSDSIHFARDAFGDILALLPLYRQLSNTVAHLPECQSLLEDIETTERAIDIQYLVENIPQSFERCSDGIGRIASIVRAMKEFAHPGRVEKGPADINQALLSTLTISRNEYKYVADIVTHFECLSPVVCHIGDLNQVFLNLIVNAAHAIASAVGDSGDKGQITICTSSDGEFVQIEVRDTGCGIPVSIRQRVFDPFFTTKEVGKGSGQGLAIARNVVVEKHGGALTFESIEGHGTTFLIRLPVDGRRRSSPPSRRMS